MKTEFIKLPKFRKKDDAATRNKRLVTLVDIALDHDLFFEADVVYVERAYGASRNSQSTLMQLLGAFVGGLARHDIRCEEINTSTWKATALKNGRAGKEEVMDWAVRLAGKEFDRQDEADALAIAYAGFLIESGT